MHNDVEVSVEVVETLKTKGFPQNRMRDADKCRRISTDFVLYVPSKIIYGQGHKEGAVRNKVPARPFAVPLLSRSALLIQRSSVFSEGTAFSELSVEKYCARMPAAGSARALLSSLPSATRHRATCGLS